MPEAEVRHLRDEYTDAHQDHVFKFYDQLGEVEKQRLFDQLSTFDLKKINRIFEHTVQPQLKKGSQTSAKDLASRLKPLPEPCTASILDTDDLQLEKWWNLGLDLIGRSKVAVVLMAGGQGTRLGSSAPKGCFDIGLPSKKSLFQLQAERIWKLQQLARQKLTSGGKEGSPVIAWYIMTSGPTRKLTEDFFKEHAYFGLEAENVTFFEQGVLPCISYEGKILMESKSKAAVAPDGNGGIYAALVTSIVLGDMRRRGIEHIHAYCVDNCLVRVADPTFIGFAAEKNVSISTKVVRKRDARESVGLILSKDGKPDVVEYSEIDDQTREAKDPKDSKLLRFRAANIVNHYYSLEFLESIPQWMDKLPHHIAQKKIPCIDMESGEVIKPEKPNGIKLEQFVFDVFPTVPIDKFSSLEVEREDEFSPLKNAKGTGEDDPDTSKRSILEQGSRWMDAVGCEVITEDSATAGVEVSPLMSYVSTW